jgi:Rrf2 family protein
VSTILRISDAVTLGLHAMVLLAADREDHLSAGEMARRLSASEAHLAKVLQRLAREGLVRSIRGPHGGFRLARACDEVTLLEVYEAIEGPLTESICLLEAPVCGGESCLLGGLIATVNRQVREHLAETRLCDLAVVRELAARAAGGPGERIEDRG